MTKAVLPIIKRAFLIAVVTLIPLAAADGGMPRIGWLSNGAEGLHESQALDQGLRDFGWVDGRTILIERRVGGGDANRLRQMAEELATLKVALILAPDPPAVAAATKATKTIPIVMRVSNDPVRSGLVKSLAHPGGNVTGVYSNADELVGKRLEMLKAAIPGLTRIAVLWDSDFEGSKRWLAEAQKAAHTIGAKVVSIEARGSKPDFKAAVNAALDAKAQALVPLRSPQIIASLEELASLTRSRRLPAIFDEQRFVQVGGLMSYGTDLRDLHRHLASYADRILKGARPEDLPIEQPTKFELVINAKTAEAIAIKIPQEVLFRADRVIE